MPTRDLYEILGVSRTATLAEIKKSYRLLARQHHPDVNPGNKAAEEKFKLINGAFEVLSNPERRKLYDEFGEDAMRIGFDEKKAQAYRQWREQSHGGAGQQYDFGDIFGGGGRGGASGGYDFDFGDLFGDLFRGRNVKYEARGGGSGYGAGPGYGSRPSPDRGQDSESTLNVDFREAILGGERELSIERPGPCPECGGTGRKNLRRCKECNGNGQRSKAHHLKVKIPPGIEDGQIIRLAGQGQPGSMGGAAGDVLLTMRVGRHPLMRREGHDLYLDVPISVGEAILGGHIEVPTLSGKIKLTVPAGSQSGDTLRLKGKGVAGRGNTAAGDFYVRLIVHVPKAPKQKEAVEHAARELESLYAEDVRAGLKL